MALQGQVTEMNKLLQSMALLQVNAVGSFVQMIKKMSKVGCVGCSGHHGVDGCLLNIETVTHVKNDPYSNTYNVQWRDHPNFSWRGQKQNVQQ